jgi:hypothetical protein
MIVKLQRPLTKWPGEVAPPVLVYNQDRSIMLHLPMDPDDMATVFQGQPKVYAEAEVIGDTMRLLRPAPPQPW